LMTSALGCWIAAAITMGDSLMLLFVALGVVLMVASLMMMRPRSSKAQALEMQP
jgi:hypothetical protein